MTGFKRALDNTKPFSIRMFGLPIHDALYTLSLITDFHGTLSLSLSSKEVALGSLIPAGERACSFCLVTPKKFLFLDSQDKGFS